MAEYKALCSDCPECGKENIVALAYSFRKTGVNDPTLRRLTCRHCFHEYQKPINEMPLRTKTEAELDAVGGAGAFENI
jgi:hypothetical protein